MRITRNDLPGREYDLLKDFISDNDSGSDVDAILANDPELAQQYRSKVPEIGPLEKCFPNTILLLNIPTKRVEKLRDLLTTKVKSTLEENYVYPHGAYFNLDVPSREFVKEDQKGSEQRGYGFAVVTFSAKLNMKRILNALSDISLDRKYSIKACMLDSMPSYIAGTHVSEIEGMEFISRKASRDWLTDSLGREQYAYRCGITSDVMWFDAVANQAQPVCEDHEQFGRAFCWSPLGTYLLTMHKRGVWIRGNDKFDKLMSFDHENVRQVLFSPDETYLITHDGNVDTQKAMNPPMLFWDSLTGECLKALTPPPTSPNGKPLGDPDSWPLYLFSPTSEYLAAPSQTGLTIYSTSTMNLIDECDPRSTINKPAWTTFEIRQYQWSPTDNLITLWIAEGNDTPGRLLIVNVDTRQEIASKNVFSVKNVSMHWSESGEFFALVTVISRRLHKKLKKDVTQIEVFRVRERSVPVDTVDLDTCVVKNLYWERGHGLNRFATLTMNELGTNQTLKFFEVPVKTSKLDTKEIQSVSVATSVNFLAWSPAGQYFVAAAKHSDGQIIFGVLNEQNKVDILSRDEQLDLTDIIWNPSGRYVTTASLLTPGAPEFRMDATAGFRIYTFLGRLLFRLESPGMSQFLWRPRPPLMIGRGKLEEVMKKLKEYSKKFDAQDEARRQEQMSLNKARDMNKLTKLTSWWEIADEYIKNHPRAQEWDVSWKELNDLLQWQDNVVKVEKLIEVIREQYK